MTQTVIGIFTDRANAEQAVDQLTSQGFDRSAIDVSSGNTELNRDSRETQDDGLGDKISRFFSNLFDDEDESSRYSTRARRGTVVTVQTDSAESASRASGILDDCGAEEMEGDYNQETAGAKRMTMDDNNDTRFGASVSPGTPVANFDELDSRELNDNSTNDAKSRSMPVIDETAEIGKREIERGGVRVRSRIIERPIEENLRLREEHVAVERSSADRPATQSDFDSFKEGTIEVRERAEVPVVDKQARVVEEVNLRKEVRERDETVRDTVRSTEVKVENLDTDEDSSLTSNTRKRK